MSFPYGVTSSYQSHRLPVVHVHPAEDVSDVGSTAYRVSVSLVALRVDVDETDGVGSQRLLAVSLLCTGAQLPLDI